LDSQELNRAIGTKDWENIPNEVTLYRWIDKDVEFDIRPWDFLSKNKGVAGSFSKGWRMKSFTVKTKDLLWDTYGNEEVIFAPINYYTDIRNKANKWVTPKK
jgi:hypothetical protein